MKTTYPLVPSLPTTLTVVETPSETAVSLGARAVSLYLGNRQFLPVGLYSLDVARAVAATVVDDVISYLAGDSPGDSPGLPDVQSGEVAELERERLIAAALECTGDSVVRWRAMQLAVAAHLRARAVAW